MNQQIEDQQGLRQLILDMSKELKAMNDRIGALESDVATIARREIKSGEQVVTPSGDSIVDCMVQMKQWRVEITSKEDENRLRQNQQGKELESLNVRFALQAAQSETVKACSVSVLERLERIDEEYVRRSEELEQRIAEKNYLGYENLQERLNEYGERLDKGNEAMAEKVDWLEQRIEGFFSTEFQETVDGRVRDIMQNLVYRVTHLSEKTEKLSVAFNNRAAGLEQMEPRSDPKTKELQETLVQLQANMDCLHRGQEEAAARLEVVDHCSLRLDRGMAELRTVIEQQEVSLNEKIATSHSDAISWFRDATVGTETVNDFSLTKNGKHMKKSDRKERKKKRYGSKRRSRYDDDPDSSDSSSSSSSSDTDDSERPRKSRKRKDDSDTESDSDEERKSTRKRSSRRDSKLLDPKHFGSGRHRASILGGDGDSNGRSDRSRGSSRQANDSIIFVQPTPVVQTLKLSEVTVGKVMHFCKTFNNESSRFRGGLNASNYIDDRLLCQMKQVALRHDLAGRDGILSNGRQEIRNKDIFAILAMMCAPTSKEEMQRQLAKSVWPRKNDFGTVEEIMKNIAEYRAETLIYVDRFEDKVKLLGFHDCSARYIPKSLFKKGGGDPGLADYFIQGLPDKNFGMRVWLSVDENRRRKCDRWRRFVKLYMRAIDLMESREKDKEINRQICLGVKEMIKADQMRQSPRPSARESPQRVHAMQRGDRTAASEEEPASDEEIEVVFKKISDEDEMPSMIEREDEDLDVDKENTRSLAVTADDLSQLANLLQPADTRKAGVCYDMLYQGKCVKENCPYSHKDEDIQQAKKLKALKFGGQNASNSKQVSFQRSPNQALRKA